MADAEKGSITIEKFQLGIGQSPHVGFGDMRNLDIFSRPGVARIGYKATKQSGSTVVELIKWLVRNPRNAAHVWGVDANNNVYKSTDDGLAWTLVAGNGSGVGTGLEIFEDYLIVPRVDQIDVYGPLSGSPSWTTNWKAIDSDNLYHPLLKSMNDGNLYGGAGRYVFSIQAVGTFDPSNAATFVFTARALDLPSDYRIKCLTELGTNLMIGTWKGVAIYDFKVGDIFPWNRVIGDSYELPLQLNESGVHAMLTVNNIMYILAGFEGKIFTSNGVQSSLAAQIPVSITQMEAGYWIEPFPGAIVSHRGRIFFGVSGGIGVTLSGMGIWSLQTGFEGNVLTLENLISTGNDGTSLVLKVGALLPGQLNSLIAGWQDGGSFGIDRISNESKYTSYAAYQDSPLYQVGHATRKVSYSQIKFQLARPLTAGQGIRLKYRKNLTDSFTTINTWDFATIGGKLSVNANSNISNAEFVQIRSELTTGSSSSTTPELRSVILS